MASCQWGCDKRHERGFTLLEMLTALVVMGIAVSLFFQLFIGAVNLKDSSSKSQSATRVAEKRITEVRANPDAFEWPRYEEAEPGALLPLYPVGQSTHVSRAGQPIEQPTDRRASNRTATHYNDLTTEVYTSLPSADANHALIVVVVAWTVDGREETYSLTTTIPRSATEG